MSSPRSACGAHRRAAHWYWQDERTEHGVPCQEASWNRYTDHDRDIEGAYQRWRAMGCPASGTQLHLFCLKDLLRDNLYIIDFHAMEQRCVPSALDVRRERAESFRPRRVQRVEADVPISPLQSRTVSPSSSTCSLPFAHSPSLPASPTLFCSTPAAVAAPQSLALPPAPMACQETGGTTVPIVRDSPEWKQLVDGLFLQTSGVRVWLGKATLQHLCLSPGFDVEIEAAHLLHNPLLQSAFESKMASVQAEIDPLAVTKAESSQLLFHGTHVRALSQIVANGLYPNAVKPDTSRPRQNQHQPNPPDSGRAMFGHGIYLTPFASLAATYAIQHQQARAQVPGFAAAPVAAELGVAPRAEVVPILVCRAVTGRSEVGHRGQQGPSRIMSSKLGNLFHSTCDSLEAPTQFCVWHTHQVLPVAVIWAKCTPRANDG